MFVYVEAFPSVEGDGMLSGVMGSWLPVLGVLGLWKEVSVVG